MSDVARAALILGSILSFLEACALLGVRLGRRRNQFDQENRMSSVTDNPNDPRLSHGADTEPTAQASVYLVLSDEERGKGFVRPLRRKYVHADGCGALTTMGLALCETYARQPTFYGSTYCTGCSMHRPVAEFRWDEDGAVVGS